MSDSYIVMHRASANVAREAPSLGELLAWAAKVHLPNPDVYDVMRLVDDAEESVEDLGTVADLLAAASSAERPYR